jgi:tetratricopeptide (TPR) repeat protein
MAKKSSPAPDALPPQTAAPRAGGALAGLRTALGRLLADRFRLLLVLTVNVAVVVGIVSTAMILRNRKPPQKPVTLTMALSALDRGNTAEARSMAERLAASKDITTEDWGGPDYVLGTLAARAAEDANGKQRAESFRLAALYLARSRERGFPAHRESAGLYLLGKSLCRCGRLEEALPVLEEALARNADQATEIRRLLMEARVGVQPPELDKALTESQKLLSDPQLADPQRPQVLVQQAEILLRMNRGKECAAVLEKISDDRSLRGDVALLRGRLALAEGQALKKQPSPPAPLPKGEGSHSPSPPAPIAKGEGSNSPSSPAPIAKGEGSNSPSPPAPIAKGEGSNSPSPPAPIPEASKEKFRWAIESFRKALSQDLGDNRVARQASYLIGLGLMELGDLPAALNQMDRTVRLFPETPECLAALYQQGDIARRMGRYPEAAMAYQRLLAGCAREDEFHNPWITLPQVKATLLGVCQEYLKAEAYENAVLLSKSLVHLMPKEQTLQLTAQVYRTWGENLMAQAEHLPPERAESLRKQARTQFRRAGDTLTEVARAQYTTREYPEQLWNSASAYFAGHDFRHGAAMLRLYLRNESRLRHAQALVDLGQAELSLGETTQALQSFQECIQQHPRDVAVYRARLLASRAAVNLGDLKQAETLLQDNLDGEQLTPASKEWRDSLFALGELLHGAARDREAIERLQESLQRYPDAPQATVARYLLADASRRRAMELRAGLEKEISSAVRGERTSESRRLLQQALEAYGHLQDNLSRRDAEDMTAQEKALLRNSRFAVGDTYFALERYPEALRAYQSAANHYASDPEVLDAYLQIANVYRRMERPAEARTSLEQARLALRRLISSGSAPEARFEQTTNFNRKQWGDLLDRLCSL